MMDKGQALLKAQYPHISGLQSVILAENYALIPQPDEFLQILNVSGNHWILLSTIGCPPATINVYDSLHGNLPPHAQRVVADLLQCKEANITIRLYMDVQWQSNGYDCGLFALANATALCSGNDPTSVTFEQSKMRSISWHAWRGIAWCLFPSEDKEDVCLLPASIELVSTVCAA